MASRGVAEVETLQETSVAWPPSVGVEGVEAVAVVGGSVRYDDFVAVTSFPVEASWWPPNAQGRCT